jgi:lipoprotein-anchoring transpeptidase ErfK/SrfK
MSVVAGTSVAHTWEGLQDATSRRGTDPHMLDSAEMPTDMPHSLSIVTTAGRRAAPAVRRPHAASPSRAAITAALGGLAALALALPANAQPQAMPGTGTVASAAALGLDTLVAPALATSNRPTVPFTSRFRSTADSAAHERTREMAERHTGMRVVVLLDERQLAVMNGADTLMVAPVAIGMDTTIVFGSKRWTFETPRGRRAVLKKEKDPVWIPPEWHYAEVASKRGLRLAHLTMNRPVRLADGRSLAVRGGRVGVLSDGQFTAYPRDEEIVFDGTLFVPPHGSVNRRIPGELGRFKLDMGNGYLLHGTPYESTIGDAATHGCVRLYDEDISWLFENVPVGTPVFIY